MAITINGSGPVAGVTTLGMTSGTITGLSAGGLPDATITQPDLAAGVAGNGPAFNVYRATVTVQVGSSGVWTKAEFNTEEFDTNSNYDTSLYRFTPTVAGYYQINFMAYMNAITALASYNGAALYKNGSLYKSSLTNAGFAGLTVPAVIYLNGSTDYVEAYFQQQSGTGAGMVGGSTYSTFSGALVRAA